MLHAIGELTSASAAAPQSTTVAKPVLQDIAERRQLTVTFCDLVGSSALSTKLDPEDLRARRDGVRPRRPQWTRSHSYCWVLPSPSGPIRTIAAVAVERLGKIAYNGDCTPRSAT
jgi:hypothetical protein